MSLAEQDDENEGAQNLQSLCTVFFIEANMKIKKQNSRNLILNSN